MGVRQNTKCNQVLETGAGVRTRCSVDVALPIAKHRSQFIQQVAAYRKISWTRTSGTRFNKEKCSGRWNVDRGADGR